MEQTSYFTTNPTWIPALSDVPDNCVAHEVARAGTTLQLNYKKEGIYWLLADIKATNIL